MFSKGEYVIYGNEGLCKIIDVTTLNMEDISHEKLYYIMTPMNSRGSTIYIPVDYKKASIRRVMTKEEAEKLVNSIPFINEIVTSNDKLREEKYKELTCAGNPVDYLTVLKSIYLRKKRREEQGKKITAVDEKYYKKAEFAIYSELSLSLSIPKENIDEYISQRVNEKNITES